MLKPLRAAVVFLLFVSATALKAEMIPDGLALSRAPMPGSASLRLDYANTELWEYLRKGLAYLESPLPNDPPESVAPGYIHPDLRGFGAYGLTYEAYADVQQIYPLFRNYGWQDILSSGQLYEAANRAFADLLLKNLQNHIPAGADKELIFDILQRAWNVGLSGFKNGKEPVSSRIVRAEEFKVSQADPH